MDDDFRAVIGLPEPPADVLATIRTVLAGVGRFSYELPRIPWAQSLQIYPQGFDLKQLGVQKRSAELPRKLETRADAPAPEPYNLGFPAHLEPLDSVAQAPATDLPEIGWDEIRKHATVDDAWLVIDGYVHDITKFLRLHPGGAAVVKPHLGKDGTAAFHRAPHGESARIMATNFRIGRLAGFDPAAAPPRPAAAARPHPHRKGAQPPSAWHPTIAAFLGLVKEYEQALLRPRPKPGRHAKFLVMTPSQPGARPEDAA
jgi:cytochrome b involved in lipid metabolism